MSKENHISAKRPASSSRRRNFISPSVPRAALVVCIVSRWFASPVALAQDFELGVVSSMVKVRPSTNLPLQTVAVLSAARNEFESFQLVIKGGDNGVDGVSATASDLTSVSGAQIKAAEIMLYRVGLYTVVTPSNEEGAPGPWPDPLIPDVDAYFGEKRNAFPFDVPAGESRAIWLEIYVPQETPAGSYTGTATVSAQGAADQVVPVTLRVFDFALRSTPHLKSAFGMGWNSACVAHHGSYEACGADSGVEAYHLLYARAALDHRISLETVVYYVDPQDTDFKKFDALYGPLLQGNASTRLPGASLTTIRNLASDPQVMKALQDHFVDKGWQEKLFDYTCDEPPNGCQWADLAAKATVVQAAGMRTLVTTDLDAAQEHGLLQAIDILTPVVNHLHGRDDINHRSEYDSFLASSDKKELWWYQSCMSHGCGEGCVPTVGPGYTGWPSYVIDATAMQNRAMEWLSFSHEISGELYFQTMHMLPQAWEDQCDFSGNGDGTLFYPGTPARIGGTTHIPVESIRLKMIREGMEDYEYLYTLKELGGTADAMAVSLALFPKPSDVTATSAAALYAARQELADKIEALSSVRPPRDAAAEGPAHDGGADQGSPTRDSGTQSDASAGCGSCASASEGRPPTTLGLLLLWALAWRSRRCR